MDRDPFSGPDQDNREVAAVGGLVRGILAVTQVDPASLWDAHRERGSPAPLRALLPPPPAAFHRRYPHDVFDAGLLAHFRCPVTAYSSHQRFRDISEVRNVTVCPISLQ